MNYKDIAKRLILLRESIWLKPAELADKLEISVQTIYKYETGQLKPSFKVLEKYSDFFNTTPNYILFGNKYDNKPDSYDIKIQQLPPEIRTTIDFIISSYEQQRSK